MTAPLEIEFKPKLFAFCITFTHSRSVASSINEDNL